MIYWKNINGKFKLFRSQESGVLMAKHSADKLSIFITGYFPVMAKHSADKLSIFITGYFPVRAKHSADKLSIFITGYFPNASPLLRPYFARTGVRSKIDLIYLLIDVIIGCKFTHPSILNNIIKGGFLVCFYKSKIVGI
ncbi:hypothetical protein [Sphaerospermopsis sp. FACHB-1194]|nr:hypothetical protein [Sphaerospermopsis sp. FACHB-1194]MBD2144924.1 hypothetical protein [Sphaerospermopsis sp. FACHB-1194]